MTLTLLILNLLACDMRRASATTSMARGVYLDRLTWRQAEAVLKPSALVVLPVGARTKEHGLHLPLNNDWVMAEYLAKRVVQALDVVALPTVEYGYYPAFVEYPGSVSIERDTFRDYIVQIIRSIARHGPKRFYVLNTGISTLRALEPAKEQLAKEGITMEYTNLLTATEEAEKKVRKSKTGTHADEIETSMMLYIAPEIVKMKLAKDDSHLERGHGPLTRDMKATTGVYSPTGAWGNPTLASRAKGKIVVEALVGHILDSIKKLR